MIACSTAGAVSAPFEDAGTHPPLWLPSHCSYKACVSSSLVLSCPACLQELGLRLAARRQLAG